MSNIFGTSVKSQRVNARAKRTRLRLAKSGGPGLSYTKVPEYISNLEGADYLAAISKLTKKQVVMIAGYPNIKVLIRENASMVTPESHHGKNTRARIKYEDYSRKNLVRAVA